ncbi:hypothetical protein [Nodularia chucula]|uniref:hypothetical protein n=1 Tax=Nodularia chucula TaxID=3093667 RepID=UPI0039C6C691
MATQMIPPELIVELSTEEQQLLSGGRKGGRGCPRRVFVPRCGPYFGGGGGRGGGGKGRGGFDGEFEDDF